MSTPTIPEILAAPHPPGVTPTSSGAGWNSKTHSLVVKPRDGGMVWCLQWARGQDHGELNSVDELAGLFARMVPAPSPAPPRSTPPIDPPP